MWRLLLFCYFVCCVAQAYSADSFALKIGENIEVLRIRQTSDQGYIVCGVLASRLADALIIKLDSNGNIEWSKTLGGPEHDFAFDCFETADRHYFVGGNTDSYAFPAVAAHSDSFIALLDPKGKLLWTKAFFGAGTDTVTGIAPAADGGVVILGETYNFEASQPENYTNLDLYLAKLDRKGKLLWTKHFGTRSDDASFRIAATSDGGYVFSGWFVTSDGGFVAKANAAGELEWIRAFPDLFGIQEVVESPPGKYVALGTFYIVGSNSFEEGDLAVIQLNSQGKVLQKKRYGSVTSFESPGTLAASTDGGTILTGIRSSTSRQPFLLKLNSKGSISWAKKIDVEEHYYSAAIETTDGGAAFVTTNSYTPMWFLKLNPAGKMPACDNEKPVRLYRKKLRISSHIPVIHFNRPTARAFNRRLTIRNAPLSREVACGGSE